MIPLYIVSSYEFFNSLCKSEETINYFKEKNINQIGIVEKNTLFYVPEIRQLAKKYKVKIIYGFSFEIKLDRDYEIILYARNDQGYLNMSKLSSFINLNKKVLEYNDLIDNKELFNNVFTVLKMDNSINISDIHDKLTEVFKNYFVGIDNKCLINEEEIKKYNLHTLYVPSINYLNKNDYSSFEVLKKLNNENIKNDYIDNYYNEKLINENDSAVKNTYVLADNCNVSFNIHVDLPSFSNNSKELIYSLCISSLKEKNLYKKEYIDRVNYELEVINKMNFNDYFLIIKDFVEYSNSNNITVGPGRGSGAGCLVAYLLNITKVDPLKYNLMFERFLNPYRHSLPDLDLDIEVKNRDKVIDYIKNKYGQDCVIGVDSFSRFKTKSTIESIGNILGINPNMISRLKRVVNNESIKNNYLYNSEFKEIIDSDNQYKELYNHSIIIEDLPSNIIAHPSGIALSSKPFKDIIPLIKVNDFTVSQIDKNYIEDFNIIKIDLLNLDTLDIISSVINKIKKINPSFDIDKINLNDEDVYKTINNLYTSNIFQLSSRSAASIIQVIKPKSFNDVVLINALNRPGPNLEEFAYNYQNRNYKIDSRLKDILDETYGIILYQEQVLQIVMRMLSVNMGEADKYRSAIKHKDPSVLDSYKDEFYKLASNNGYELNTIEYVFSALRKYCGYGFNKSHAVAYSLISYQMAYLKTKYPTYFFSTILDLRVSDIGLYLKELKYFKIKLIRNINYCDLKYRFNEDTLFLPLTLIKNINYVSEIIEERNKNGLYTSYLNCCVRLFKLKLTINDLENLIYAGYMDCFKLNRNIMLKNLEDIYKTYLFSEDTYINESYKDLDDRTKYLKELELIGFSSVSILNNYLKEYNLKPLSIQLRNKEINSIGIIKDIRIKKTKNNKDMCFIDIIDDEANMINGVYFNDDNGLSSLKINMIVKFNAYIYKDRRDYIIRYVDEI